MDCSSLASDFISEITSWWGNYKSVFPQIESGPLSSLSLFVVVSSSSSEITLDILDSLYSLLEDDPEKCSFLKKASSFLLLGRSSI